MNHHERETHFLITQESSTAQLLRVPAGTAEPLATPYDREAAVVLGGTAEFASRWSHLGNGGLFRVSLPGQRGRTGTSDGSHDLIG